MTRSGKAVETAALWKRWKNGSIEKPTNDSDFSTVTTALGKRLALLARFPQLHTASTIGYTNRFHRPASRGPESTEAVSQRPPHGHTAHRLRAAGRTASPQRVSEGLK